MRIQDLLRAQYQQAHTVVEQVIDDVGPDALTHVAAEGNVGAIGAIYAHLVYDEDGMIGGPAGRESIWESGGWSAKTGLEMPGPMQTEEWTRSGPQYDLAAFREYAQAVYAATDDYLANASDEALAAEIDTFAGKQPAAQYLGTMCLWHVQSHQGEISALKGIQGLKGLPF